MFEPYDLIPYLNSQRNWSVKTFGDAPRLQGVINHIEEELMEIKANLTDIEEWVDLIRLAFDGALRSGATAEEIVKALVQKQLKCEQRTWPDYRNYTQHEKINHIPTDWPEGTFKPGTIVRYDIGLTALMRIDKAIVLPYKNKKIIHYAGRQCFLGYIVKPNHLVTLATDKDIEIYRKRLYWFG